MENKKSDLELKLLNLNISLINLKKEQKILEQDFADLEIQKLLVENLEKQESVILRISGIKAQINEIQESKEK